MKKRIIVVAVIAALLGQLATVSIAVEYGREINPEEKVYKQSFTDVAPDHWAFNFIEELVERGAINGYPDGKFYPNKTVTREEFAKIMVVAAGLTATPADASSYADVPLSYWASPFIETAKPYMTAYQSGGQAYFKPTDGALREDMAVAVVMLKGYDTRLADLSMIHTMFSDIDAISTGAQPYVALAVENGIISGYQDGTFRGQATITRCEAAAILWRAFQYGGDNKLMPGEVPDPVEIAEPTQTTEPTASPEMPEELPQEEKLPYVMDTAIELREKCRSMVLTNDSVVYCIDGGELRASNSELTVDLEQGLNYPLKIGDKNRSFALEAPTLAYDSEKEIVYLLGNEQRRMVIYDVTDLSAPTCILAADLKGTTYTGSASLYVTTDYMGNQAHEEVPYIQALSNGMLLVPIREDRVNGVIAPCTCMISPSRGTVSLWGELAQKFVVVGDKAIYLNGDTTMEVASITAPMDKTLVSIEGALSSKACAGPDGIYFWDSEGLISLDLDGWRHQKIGADQIECVDLMPIVQQVKDICVNAEGSCAIYDAGNHLIRILSERTEEKV